MINDRFFDEVASLVEQARKHIGSVADLTMCFTNYIIGGMIVEKEQDGKSRAQYGRGLITELSAYLNTRFGKGFSETNLRNFRKFYQIYSPSIQQNDSVESRVGGLVSIQQNGSAEFDIGKLFPIRQNVSAEFNPFKLGWSHYQVLMRIKNDDERRFYEIEAINEQWSYEQLKWQYSSSLYERLALSRDKDEVMRLAREGQTMEKTQDILKNPLVLEFYGLEEKAAYSESDLESAIITNLQEFLLELGKGFLFEARQKRFTFNEKHFKVDLVLYNRLLRCYVLINLKKGELKHQDLGQMQMYVHYFDRHVKTKDENPTVGILLCGEKDDAIVELTLPEGENIYASEYSLYLPDKAILQRKLAEWIEEFEDAKAIRETADGGDGE